MTQVLDHGKWVLYQPDTRPEHAPSNALFARRESDGVDWYAYSRDPNNFTADTVKFTAMWQDSRSGFVIGAATFDATALFPAGALLREIIDYHGGSDPQLELGARLYDPDTNKLHNRPPPPPALDLRALEARVAAIEAKLGITP